MENLTWNEQFVIDNTWQKTEAASLEYCDICDKDTMQSYVSGSNAFDRYSYSVCHDKNHAEKERLNKLWLEEQRQKYLRGEKGTIYDK